MKQTKVTLVPLSPDDREQFILDGTGKVVTVALSIVFSHFLVPNDPKPCRSAKIWAQKQKKRSK